MRDKCDKQRPCSRCIKSNLASTCSSVADHIPSRKRARTDPTCPEASALPMRRMPDELRSVHPLKHRALVQTASAFSERAAVGADSASRGVLAAAIARDSGESQEAMVRLFRLPANPARLLRAAACPPTMRSMPAKVGPLTDFLCHSLGCQTGAWRQRATGYEPAPGGEQQTRAEVWGHAGGGREHHKRKNLRSAFGHALGGSQHARQGCAGSWSIRSSVSRGWFCGVEQRECLGRAFPFACTALAKPVRRRITVGAQHSAAAERVGQLAWQCRRFWGARAGHMRRWREIRRRRRWRPCHPGASA
jgi:hypothetical protein